MSVEAIPVSKSDCEACPLYRGDRCGGALARNACVLTLERYENSNLTTVAQAAAAMDGLVQPFIGDNSQWPKVKASAEDRLKEIREQIKRVHGEPVTEGVA